MMDIIFTVGQYTIVSMYLNSAGVQLEKARLAFHGNHLDTSPCQEFRPAATTFT